VPHIRGWVGGRGREGGGLTLLVDTADQAVCPVDQTCGHSSPDHTTSQADVQWNSLGPQATPLCFSLAPHGLLWLDQQDQQKAVCKSKKNG